MYESNSNFIQSEIAYRADRIRVGVARGRGRSGGRVRVARRPAEAVARTR